MAQYTLPPGEKGQFALIPEGVYKMQIQAPKIAYSRGTGNPTIECYLAAVEGIYAGERVYHQYVLTPDSMWRIRDDLRTLGRLPRDKFPIDQPVNLQDTEMVTLLDGAIGYASIFIDTFKGAPRSKLATEGFLTPQELSQRGITPTAAPAPAPTPAPTPTPTPAPAPAPAPPVTPPPGVPPAAEPF